MLEWQPWNEHSENTKEPIGQEKEPVMDLVIALFIIVAVGYFWLWAASLP